MTVGSLVVPKAYAGWNRVAKVLHHDFGETLRDES